MHLDPAPCFGREPGFSLQKRDRARAMRSGSLYNIMYILRKQAGSGYVSSSRRKSLYSILGWTPVLFWYLPDSYFS